MKVTITGATGLIGRRIVERLRARGDEVVVLSRDPDRAKASLGVPAFAWDPLEDRAPLTALTGTDAVLHLAGENVAQRWTSSCRQVIKDSREIGTRNLVAGIAAAEPRPSVLISSSAVGYYGPHGDEIVTEEDPPGRDFLAEVCVAWEREALAAAALGLRVSMLRTGVVLDRSGGALKKMLLPFRLGVGGPVAGGKHYMPWIHIDDMAGFFIAALDDGRWSGPVNACAPEPVTNKAFSKALGRALHRPAVAPVPAFALRLMYGDMAEIVVTGQRVVPRRAVELGYTFEHADLDEALHSALAR